MSTFRNIAVVTTEPGCGGTTVTRGLAAAFSARQLAVRVMKPVAVGCPFDVQQSTEVQVGGLPGVQDQQSLASLQRLAELAGPPPASLSGPTPAEALEPTEAKLLLEAVPRQAELRLVNPYRFAPNLEPAAAARAGGVVVDLLVLDEAFAALCTGEVNLLDAGPLMEPLNDEATVLDLVERWSLAVLLVAPSRPRAAVSPCLLALRLLRSYGFPVAGVVLNRLDPQLNMEEAVNPFLLEQHAGDVVRGLLPHLKPKQLADPHKLGERVRVHVDTDRILAECGL